MVYVDEDGKSEADYIASLKTKLISPPSDTPTQSSNFLNSVKTVIGVILRYVAHVMEDARENETFPLLSTAIQLRQDWRYLIFSLIGIGNFAKWMEDVEDTIWWTGTAWKQEYQFEMWTDPALATYGYRVMEFEWAEDFKDFWNSLTDYYNFWNLYAKLISGLLVLSGLNKIDKVIPHYVIKKYRWRLDSTKTWSDWIDLSTMSYVANGVGMCWLIQGETNIYRSLGFSFWETFKRRGKAFKDWGIPGSENLWFYAYDDENEEPVFKKGTDSYWHDTYPDQYPTVRKYRIINDFLLKDSIYVIILVGIIWAGKKMGKLANKLYQKHLAKAGRKRLKRVENTVLEINDKLNDPKDQYYAFRKLTNKMDALNFTESLGVAKILSDKLGQVAPKFWGR